MKYTSSFALLIFELSVFKMAWDSGLKWSQQSVYQQTKLSLGIIETICVNPFLLVIIKSFALRNPLDSDTEFVRVEDPLTAVGRTFISALLASGFREIYDDNRYNAEFLPCPLGTFYNSSSRGEQGCIQCPPGKLESPSSYWEMKSESFRKPWRRRQQLNVIKKMFNEHENGPVHAFWILLYFSAVLKKKNQCEIAKSYVFALHTAAVLAERGPAKTYLSYQNNMIIAFLMTFSWRQQI